MRIRNLAVTATLIPVLMLAGCGNDESGDVARSSPGAKESSEHGVIDPAAKGAAADENADPSDDPVINAHYEYRVAFDVMMRSGGESTKQLIPVMTPALYKSISQQARYYRAKKLHNTGETKVLWAKRALGATGVIVRACYDTTRARTINARGRSVLPATAPTRWLDEMRVELLEGVWVVDGGRTTPEKC